MKLNVSDIQHFTVGDGEGIRTTVFLKGCSLRCPWCHNPETITAESVKLEYQHKSITSGRLIETSEIMREVMEDCDFYGEDGGLTVSGGEPMLQADGVAELLRMAIDAGITTVIDTAGFVPYSSFEKMRGLVTEYYFDLKACCGEDYKKLGGNFDIVTGNIVKLIEAGENIRIRIPLIPGFNDSDEYSEAMCEVIKAIGGTKVDILPFHRLGVGKYDALGLDYAYRDTRPKEPAEVERTADIYRNYFTVRIEK